MRMVWEEEDGVHAPRRRTPRETETETDVGRRVRVQIRLYLREYGFTRDHVSKNVAVTYFNGAC